MVSFARSKARRDAAMSADFERELRREVLRTELLRVRALIMSGCIILLFEAGVNLFDPDVISRVCGTVASGWAISTPWSSAFCSSSSGCTRQSGTV